MAAMFNYGRPVQNVFQVSLRVNLQHITELKLLQEEIKEASLATVNHVQAGFAGAIALAFEEGNQVLEECHVDDL